MPSRRSPPRPRLVRPPCHADSRRRQRRYGRRIEVKSVSDGELDALLCSAFAVEELVRPDADALVVVVASPDGSRPWARLEQLASLPCIVIGDGHSPVDPPPHLDVLAEEGVATVDRLLATIETNPIAAVTLAMFLRGAESRSLGAGLVAESSAYSLLQAGPEFERWLAGWNRRERPPETEPPVLVHRDGDCLELTLNRPHVRNALDRSMRDALTGGTRHPAGRSVGGHGRCVRSWPRILQRRRSRRLRLVRGPGQRGRRPVGDEHRTCHRRGTRSCDSPHARVVRGFGGRTARVRGACGRCCGYAVLVAGDRLGTDSGRGGTVSLTRRIGRHRVALPLARWVSRRCCNRGLMGTRRRGRVVARLAGRATDAASRLCRDEPPFPSLSRHRRDRCAVCVDSATEIGR